MMNGEADNLSVKTFRDMLVENHVSLAFHGVITQDILSLLGHRYRNSHDNLVVSKRIFAIIIELAQNILHYSAEKVFSEKDQREVGVGVIGVSETASQFIISSGNYIYPDDAAKMVERCNFINSLGNEELKEYYREQRRMPQREGKPGANLGFIDMRRKSGNPIEIEVWDQELNKPFFVLTIKVNKEF